MSFRLTGGKAEGESVYLHHSGLICLSLTQLLWSEMFLQIEMKTASQAQIMFSMMSTVLHALGVIESSRFEQEAGGADMQENISEKCKHKPLRASV